MKASNKNFDTSSLLPLDAAPLSVIDQTVQIRSLARLEQILALPPDVDPSPTGGAIPAGVPRRAPNPRWRWAAIPVLAATVLALSILLPGSPGTAPAYASLASWQGVPVALAEPLVPSVESACGTTLNTSMRVNRALPPEPIPLGESIVLDARGDWATVVFETPYGPATCLVWLDPVAGPIVATAQLLPNADLESNLPTDSRGIPQFSSVLVNTWEGLFLRMRSYANPELVSGARSAWYMPSYNDAPALAPDETRTLFATESNLNQDDAFATVMGEAGSDVTEIVLHTVAGDVTASLADGWFFAWWPFSGDGSLCFPIGPDVSSGVDCGMNPSWTVTLRDGTTKEIPGI